VLEDDALNLRVAERWRGWGTSACPGGIIFKASFDKANRSNAGAPRGPGLDEGLRRARPRARGDGLPCSPTCICPSSARRGEVADVLQIPAFLCRQTDLLLAAGRHGQAGEREEGAVDGPEEMRARSAKVRGAGVARRWRSPSGGRSSATATWWWTPGDAPGAGEGAVGHHQHAPAGPAAAAAGAGAGDPRHAASANAAGDAARG
jgi:3-deoxy-D-manno-octulosonic acid (KDO) 8-phosphate synthase